MLLKKVWSLVGVAIVAGASLLITNVKAGSPSGVTDLKFKTFIQAGQPEQDVYLQSSTGSEQVFRLKPEDAQFRSNLDKRAYASTAAVPHDPLHGPMGRLTSPAT